MVQEFHDTQPGNQHDAFVRWKDSNPGGFILNVLSSSKAMLHRAKCQHLSGPHQVPAEGKSLTSQQKICSLERGELDASAAEDSLQVEECASCRP